MKTTKATTAAPMKATRLRWLCIQFFKLRLSLYRFVRFPEVIPFSFRALSKASVEVPRASILWANSRWFFEVRGLCL